MISAGATIRKARQLPRAQSKGRAKITKDFKRDAKLIKNVPRGAQNSSVTWSLRANRGKIFIGKISCEKNVKKNFQVVSPVYVITSCNN